MDLYEKMVKLELYVDLPEWFDESVEKINYLFPKSRSIGIEEEKIRYKSIEK